MIDIVDLTLYHFPGCPFSERVEILFALRGLTGLRDVVIDISAPRPDWLLAKTGGATALPALETPFGTVLESTAILRFLDNELPGERLAHAVPYRHAVEEMFAALAPGLSAAGYRMIQNQDPDAREALRSDVDTAYGRLDSFLRAHSTGSPWLTDRFGWAEALLTPTLKRLWFLDYYEDYRIPAQFDRLAVWRQACLEHPATQAHGMEEIVKLYHDYARGFGSGRLPPGRSRSSFSPVPHWTVRPMPPRDKWGVCADDAMLGLVD